jgi:hypothetical protein
VTVRPTSAYPFKLDPKKCPAWCEPAECSATKSAFHPDSPPPAHRSRRISCNPGNIRRATELAVQLVRFVDDPEPPRDFVRLEVGDFDSRQSFHIQADQGWAQIDALTALLGVAGNPAETRLESTAPAEVDSGQLTPYGDEPGS